MYLTKNDEPTLAVRCPVHGFIHFSVNERQIIDHPIFQRLRRIKQLALCQYVYPGASHTRIEHSLGVMEMATRAFETLAKNHRSIVRQDLEAVPEFKDKVLEKARQVLRLFALLHDTGHTAFSHVPESLIPGSKHEAVSSYVVKQLLGEDLDRLFFRGIADLIVKLIQQSPEMIFLRQFVAGEIDMDRTDYLLRDSLHCGVQYGRFDFRQLLESLTVIQSPDTGRLQLALYRGGEHTFEALIQARYQMSTQVYYHKIRRIYDHYILEYMRAHLNTQYKSLADVLKDDDLTMLVKMQEDAAGEGPKAEYARRIIERRHHKVVYNTGDTADFHVLTKVKRIYKKVREEFPKVDFYLDVAEGSIHKLTIPGQHEEGKVEDFFVVEKWGHKSLLTHDSEILKRMPKSFRVVRIYADGKPDNLKKISEFAEEESIREGV